MCLEKDKQQYNNWQVAIEQGDIIVVVVWT